MRTIAEFLRDAAKYGSLGKAALHWQCKHEPHLEEEIVRRMHERLKVMRESAHAGLAPDLRSVSGMVGGQASLMNAPEQIGRFGLLGKAFRGMLGTMQRGASREDGEGLVGRGAADIRSVIHGMEGRGEKAQVGAVGAIHRQQSAVTVANLCDRIPIHRASQIVGSGEIHSRGLLGHL